MAYGGEVTAILRLDGKQFQKDIAAAQKTLQGINSGTSGKGLQQVQKQIQNTGKEALNSAKNIKGFGDSAQGAASKFAPLIRNVNGLGSAVTSTFGKTVTFSSSLGNVGKAAEGATSRGAMGFQRFGQSISTAAQGLNQFASGFVSFDIWMAGLVGGAFLSFTVGAAMSVDRSIQLMKYVGMTSAEVEKLNQATKTYASNAALVSQPEMLDAWRIVRLSAKLNGDQMISNNGVMGDTIALFKMQGRTALDAGRAVEDALSGNYMRFKEINIKKSDLIKAGWSGNKEDANGYFQALQKIYKDRGILGLANSTASVAAKWENVREKLQLVGVAIGQELLPMVTNILESMNSFVSSSFGATVTKWTIIVAALGFTFALLLPVIGNLLFAIPRLIAIMIEWRGTATFIQAATMTNVEAMGVLGTAITGLRLRFANFIRWLRSGEVIASLSENPYLVLAAAIAAVTAAIIIYGQQQGWFSSATDNATKHLNDYKEAVGSAKTQVTNAKNEVEKWRGIVAQTTPGTTAYTTASNNLATAKRNLAIATSNATQTEQGYKIAVDKHATVMTNYGTATDKARKELIAYKVSIGVLTPEQGKLAITTGEAAAGLSDADIEIVKATDSTNKYKDEIKKTSDTVKKDNPFKNTLTSLTELRLGFHRAAGGWEKFKAFWWNLSIVGGVAKDVWDRFWYSYNVSTKTAVDNSNNFKKSLGGIKDAITKPFQGAVTTIRDWWNALTKGTTGGKATAWITPIIDAWKDLKGAIHEAIVAFTDALGVINVPSTGTATGKVGLSPLSLIFGSNKKPVQENISLIKDLINAWNAFWAALYPPQATAKTGLNFLGLSFKEKKDAGDTKDLVNTIAGAIRNLAKWIRDNKPTIIAVATVLKDDIIPAIADLIIFVGKVIGGIRDFEDAARPWYDLLVKIYHVIHGSEYGITPALRDLWSAAQTVWAGMLDLIRPVYDPLKKIWDILVKISQFKMPKINIPEFKMPTINIPGLSGIMGGLGNIGGTLGGLITGKISLTDLGNKAWEKLKEKIGNFVGRFNLNVLWQNAKSWVLQKLSYITGRFNLNVLWQNAKSWVLQKVSYITGRFNLQSLWNNAKSWVYEKIKNITGKFNLTKLAQDAKDWVKQNIPSFRWPWGPAGPAGPAKPSGLGVGVRAKRALDIPHNSSMRRGAIEGMSQKTRIGGGGGSINNASKSNFKGLSAFKPLISSMMNTISYNGYWGNPKSDEQVWSSRSCNCWDGAELVAHEGINYFGLHGTSDARTFWSGLPHRYAILNNMEFDSTNFQKNGNWSKGGSGRSGGLSAVPRVGARARARGPSGPVGMIGSPRENLDFFMSQLGPTLDYLGYEGHGKNPFLALSEGGNCFDMTLGIMDVASKLFGVPAQMVWGTYGGNSHVWANLGGKNYDLSRRALEGTYTPPPRGPGGSGTTIIIKGDCYGYEDFVRQVEKANNTSISRTW